MFSGGIVTGPALVAIFILAIAILLLLIIKFQVNAFVALLLTGYITGVVANMPLGEIAQTVYRRIWRYTWWNRYGYRSWCYVR